MRAKTLALILGASIVALGCASEASRTSRGSSAAESADTNQEKHNIKSWEGFVNAPAPACGNQPYVRFSGSWGFEIQCGNFSFHEGHANKDWCLAEIPGEGGQVTSYCGALGEGPSDFSGFSEELGAHCNAYNTPLLENHIQYCENAFNAIGVDAVRDIWTKWLNYSFAGENNWR